MQAIHRPLASLFLAATLGIASMAHAQGAAPDAEKQKLIDHILTLYHPENSVLVAIQRPATEALEKSSIALQTAHVPKDRSDKTMKDIGTDVQKYVDSTMPMAIASAKKNVGPAAGPLLAQNFTTEELRQLVAFLESPVKSKFEKLVPQMENAVGQKVQADVGVQANKNIQVLTESVGTKLRVAATLN